jgi:hypothetical protein
MYAYELIAKVKSIFGDSSYNDYDTRFDRTILIMEDFSIMIYFEDELVDGPDERYMILTEHTSNYWRERCKCDPHDKITSDMVSALWNDAHIHIYTYIYPFEHDIDRVLKNAIQNYYVPRCQASWILGAMNYAKNIFSDVWFKTIFIHDGYIIGKTFNENGLTIYITKNSLLLTRDIRIRYIIRDFTQDFMAPSIINFGKEDIDFNIPSTDDCVPIHFNGAERFETIVHKVYHTYIDYVHPRRFVGFEDVCVVADDDI